MSTPSAIFRRHLATNKVRGLTGISKESAFAARHARQLRPTEEGYAVEGTIAAYEQGQELAKRGVNLVRLFGTFDDRNFDGAEATRQGYEKAGGKGAKDIIVAPTPLCTYPVYNPTVTTAAVQKYGEDYVLHRWLGGAEDLADLITSESPEGFLARVRHFVGEMLTVAERLGGVVFVDGNFEFCLALYLLYIEGRKSFGELATLPKNQLWIPPIGQAFNLSGDPKQPVAKMLNTDMETPEEEHARQLREDH